MYVVYEEHIEQLEEENEELKQEVLVLKRKLEYYIKIEQEEEWMRKVFKFLKWLWNWGMGDDI